MGVIKSGQLLAVFVAATRAAAATVCGAPWHHQGVRVIFNKLGVEINAVRAGQTLHVFLGKIATGVIGTQQFFLTFNDVEDICRALHHNADAPCALGVQKNPLTRKSALYVEVGDWFTAHIGDPQPDLPFRALECRHRHAGLSEIENAASLIAPLSLRGPRSRNDTDAFNNPVTTVWAETPIPGVEAARIHLY